MVRLVFLLMAAFLGACNAKDARSINVEQLKKQVETCRDATTNVCLSAKKELVVIYELGLKLQREPQTFGLTMLNLQTEISALKAQLKSLNKNNSKTQYLALQNQIKAKEETYYRYLSVVKWLEAPNS